MEAMALTRLEAMADRARLMQENATLTDALRVASEAADRFRTELAAALLVDPEATPDSRLLEILRERLYSWT
jgi:predicted protein tyrosine phosphatase